MPMTRKESGSVPQAVGGRQISRRDLLGRGLAFGAAGLAAPYLLEGRAWAVDRKAAADVSGTIDFLSWDAYDLRFPLMNNWRKQHGISMQSTYISDYPEIPAKLTSPASRGLYNLATYGAQYGQQWKELGILTPLDMSKIPNYSNSLAFFKSGPSWKNYWNFDGHQWGIPFTWSYSANNYNAAKIGPPKKTADFLMPEFKKKFALNDDYQGEILLAAQVLKIANQKGLFTKAQLQKIVEFLTELKRNALLIAPSNGDIANLFASGEIIACVDGFLGMQELVAQKGVKSIRSVVPAEGTFSFVDSYFIPAGSKNADSVYAFINESLAPPMQAQESGYLQAGITTVSGVAALSATDKAQYQPANVQALFAQRAPV